MASAYESAPFSWNWSLFASKVSALPATTAAKHRVKEFSFKLDSKHSWFLSPKIHFHPGQTCGSFYYIGKTMIIQIRTINIL
jgi:hypothetical protein